MIIAHVESQSGGYPYSPRRSPVSCSDTLACTPIESRPFAGKLREP